MRQSLFDRRLGGRNESRPQIARFGAGAATRSVHAPAHVEQARGVETRARLRLRLPPVASVLAASFALGLGGGVSLAEAAAAWLGGGPPQISVIGVRGAQQLAAAEVGAATGVPRAIDLRGVDPAAVAAQLARHPWIAEARAAELPSGRLLVAVVERQAVATVSARGSEQGFAVDANGTPFAALASDARPELPRLVQHGPVALGETNPDLAAAVELAAQLGAAGLPQALEIEVAPADDPTGFVLRLADFAPRVVLGRDDPGARLAALARVLAAAPPEAARAEILDLRFADQVVLRGTPSASAAADATEQHGGAATSGSAAPGGRGDPKQGG